MNCSFRKGNFEVEPIQIGKGTWVASHAIVTAGVSIGVGSLVGASAVVTHAIPDDTMSGGVPARPINPLLVKKQLKNVFSITRR